MGTQKTNPIIVASENGTKGAIAAMELMNAGGTALDAVEIACRIVEDDPADHSVGYGGLPNILGVVELDASIMDGQSLKTGAVAAVKGYGNPITLARRVMDDLPHVLLAGEGAERFADELGMEKVELLSDIAKDRWHQRIAPDPSIQNVDPGAFENLRELANQFARPLNLKEELEKAKKIDTLGTVNFLAIDRQGNIASAVSTSGLGWKYPGRVGDSPIVGAGNYCDNRYGAAACTGQGELAIRASTARSVVLYMKMGMSLQEAGLEALRDLQPLTNDPLQYMNIVALTPTGEPAGFSSVSDRRYIYMTPEMDEPTAVERLTL